MKKLIIIPAYNEELNIKKVVNYIISTVPDYDHIVINDGSTDKTEEICKSEGFKYISLPVNLGIGGAVQTGYRYALENQYDIAVQIDGDGQHDCRDLDRLLENLKKNRFNMVIGSRFISKEGFQSSFTRRLGISYFSSLIKGLTKVKITDPTSGLRMCDRKVIELFAKEYPTDYPEPESIVTIIRKGLSVGEVEARMKERQGGVSSINAMKAVYYMIKVTLAILVSYASNKNRIGGLQTNDA